jgi:ribosomal protein S18 acetylase RimI-like enzyme
MLACLHDRSAIEVYLRADPYLHLYELGDLDDRFWPRTQWYGWLAAGRLHAVVLLYSGFRPPVLLALASPPRLVDLRSLLTELTSLLPIEIFTHLTPGLEACFTSLYLLEHHGLHLKMALAAPGMVGAIDTDGVLQLTESDLNDLERLYAENYPDNAFDPHMLSTGCTFGLRQGGQLVTAAGVHVFSPLYRVAALGNIVTHRAYRGRGLGTRVTARLIQHLTPLVDQIGLNVKADNLPAIAIYEKLGFTPVAEYHEVTLTRQLNAPTSSH